MAGSNALRHTKFTCDNDVAVITRPDKTGSRSMLIGVKGRASAKWSYEGSLAPNGTLGTVPDADDYLQALMGQASTLLTTNLAISGATNATPIVLTTATNTLVNGDLVSVAGVTGNTAANGIWQVSAVSATSCTLVGSVGNGAYGSGGTVKQSIVYRLSDSIPSLSLWSFRQPSTLDQRVAFGAVAQEGTIALGDDVATMAFSGEAVWALSSNQFGAADSTQAGGLSAFPSEPGSPVTNGNMVAGFTGKIVANGGVLATMRTGQVRIQTGNTLVKDTFGTYYPSSLEGDERNVGLQFSVYEDDSTSYANLIAAANSKTPMNAVLQIGTVSGSICCIVVNNIQLASPTMEEQQRYIANFPESRAKASSITAKDEVSIWFF